MVALDEEGLRFVSEGFDYDRRPLREREQFRAGNARDCKFIGLPNVDQTWWIRSAEEIVRF